MATTQELYNRATPEMKALYDAGMPYGQRTPEYAAWWNQQPMEAKLAASKNGTWMGDSLRTFLNERNNTALPDATRQQIALATGDRREIGYTDPTQSVYRPPTIGMSATGGPMSGGTTVNRSYSGPAGGNTLTNAVMPGSTTLPAGVAGGGPASTGMNSGTSGFGTGTGLAGSEAALLGGLNQAQGQLSQYQREGQGASQMQAALSGALGPEAQAQAFADFQESPGQDYLRDRSEQAILRNAAATGGLGGGNVLKALQGNAMGLAAQDFGDSFNRMGAVADRGYSASRMGADMTYGTGNTLAGGRTRVGEQISGNIGNTTSALAQLQQQLGQGQANTIGQDTGNLASLLQQMGQSQNLNANQLATILANLSTGQGSAVASLPSIGSFYRPDNSMSSLMQALGGIASAYNQSQQGA